MKKLLATEQVAQNERTPLQGLVTQINSVVEEARGYGFDGKLLSPADLLKILQLMECGSACRLSTFPNFLSVHVENDRSKLEIEWIPPRPGEEKGTIILTGRMPEVVVQGMTIPIPSPSVRFKAQPGLGALEVIQSTIEGAQFLADFSRRRQIQHFPNISYEVSLVWKDDKIEHDKETATSILFRVDTTTGEASFQGGGTSPIRNEKPRSPKMHTHNTHLAEEGFYHSSTDITGLALRAVGGYSRFSVVLATDGKRGVLEIIGLDAGWLETNKTFIRQNKTFNSDGGRKRSPIYEAMKSSGFSMVHRCVVEFDLPDISLEPFHSAHANFAGVGENQIASFIQTTKRAVALLPKRFSPIRKGLESKNGGILLATLGGLMASIFGSGISGLAGFFPFITIPAAIIGFMALMAYGSFINDENGRLFFRLQDLAWQLSKFIKTGAFVPTLSPEDDQLALRKAQTDILRTVTLLHKKGLLRTRFTEEVEGPDMLDYLRKQAVAFVQLPNNTTNNEVRLAAEEFLLRATEELQKI